MDCELPDGLKPMKAPAWLADACAHGSATADELVDKYIVYKWPARLGGWAVGKVTGTLTAGAHVKQGQCNFTVFYECDQESAEHALSSSAYAKSAKSPADSWVLLG